MSLLDLPALPSGLCHTTEGKGLIADLYQLMYHRTVLIGFLLLDFLVRALYQNIILEVVTLSARCIASALGHDTFMELIILCLMLASGGRAADLFRYIYYFSWWLLLSRVITILLHEVVL